MTVTIEGVWVGVGIEADGAVSLSGAEIGTVIAEDKKSKAVTHSPVVIGPKHPEMNPVAALRAVLAMTQGVEPAVVGIILSRQFKVI